MAYILNLAYESERKSLVQYVLIMLFREPPSEAEDLSLQSESRERSSFQFAELVL